jgi:hypothetical protein
LFIRAKAGVRPFPAAKAHRAGSWGRFVALGAAVSVLIAVALLLFRRGGIVRRHARERDSVAYL